MRTVAVSLFVFIALSPLAIQAQRPVTVIDQKIDSLRKSGIDTILLYQETFYGFSFSRKDSCQAFEPGFLIWKSDDKVFYQQFRVDLLSELHCISEPARYENSAIFFLLSKYADEIKVERFQPFIAKFECDGQAWHQPLFTFHPTYYRIEFYWEKEDVRSQPPGFEHYPDYSSEVATFHLKDRHDNVVNLNYQHNVNTQTYKLIKCIQMEIGNLGGELTPHVFVK